MFIKLNGKEYELKFTYKSILYLENYYQKGIGTLFNDVDFNSVGALTTFLWAMLKNESDWKNASFDDVVDAVENALETGELTLIELGQKIGDALNNSMVVKSMQQPNQPNEAGKPGKKG